MSDPDDGHEGFFPRGTVAFFAIMIAVYAGLWLVMYGLMTARG